LECAFAARPSGSLLHLDDLVRDEPVREPVHPLGRFHARRAAQADHRAVLLVEPVLEVLDVVLALDLEVPLVRVGHALGRQPLDVPVDVDVQRHSFLLVQCAALACWHVTVGFQSANTPLGFSFSTHTCSAHSPNVKLCFISWPNSVGAAWSWGRMSNGMTYSTPTSSSEPFARGS